MQIKRSVILSILFGFLYFICIHVSYAANIDKIVAFGDSLSDNGNVYAFTLNASKFIPYFPVVPKNPPYYSGRFSNGPIWLENLSIAMDVPLLNYAYGGSWAEPYHDSGIVFPLSLSSQVSYYEYGSTDHHQEDHLFVIWSGANDYIQGRDDHEYATDNTVSNIKDQIDWLISHGGAKHFLLPNLPDISVTPDIVKKGPEFVRLAAELISMHNRKFKAMVEQEKKDHPDVDFVLAEVTEVMGDLIAHPKKYNLKNVTDACYGGEYWLAGMKMDERELNAAKEGKNGQFKMDILRSPDLRIAYLTALMASKGAKPCANADEYLYWDQLHPTRMVHQLIGAGALKMLQDNNLFGASSKRS